MSELNSEIQRTIAQLMIAGVSLLVITDSPEDLDKIDDAILNKFVVIDLTKSKKQTQ